jgi:hypothetical protein
VNWNTAITLGFALRQFMKRHIALAAAVAAIFAGCSTPSTGAWEYRKLRAELGTPFETAINDLGTQGWELVAVSESSAYFKRRKTR